ncbi:helix-turn-helix domain-containing protein [Promicromonospora sp. NPDC050262]|uniref:helix-turn-helix domain-containing protein n=1 Tax=Promicromonospora sp. NPDC050262 TaxID=3155036 RepID=UPI0033F08F2F
MSTATETQQIGPLTGLFEPDLEFEYGVRWSTLEEGPHLRCMDAFTTSESGRPDVGLEPLLSTEDLADYLGIPVATLQDWRVDHKGPRGIIVGRRVKYAVSDVRAWIEQQRETRPGDHTGGR